jgi:hypothetical protein
MKNEEFISLLNKINQLFKGIYNSGDKFQNIWNVQDGRFIMHHETQLPSFVEITLDSSELVTAKGVKNAKGLLYDEFLSFFDGNISLNSIAYFNYLKTLDKKAIGSISIKDNLLYVDEDCISDPYVADKLVFDKKDEYLVASFDLGSDNINKIVELANKPFNLIFNITEDKVQIDEDVNREEVDYLNVKTSLKFLPYLEKCTAESGCNVYIDVYQTDDDNLYDIVFRVSSYSINKKGETKTDPISIRYGIRILEL